MNGLVDRNQIARQDSTLLALIVQAKQRNADPEMIKKYIDLLTLESSKIRAQQIVSSTYVASTWR